jgi:hypothetical protein
LLTAPLDKYIKPPVSDLISELVPKLIDYALKRMVLEQALAVFQAKALQNCGI